MPQVYDDGGLSATTGGGKDGVSMDGGGDVQFTGGSHHGRTRSNKDGADGGHFRFLSLRHCYLRGSGLRCAWEEDRQGHGPWQGHRQIRGQSAEGVCKTGLEAGQLAEAAQRRPGGGRRHDMSRTASLRWGSIRLAVTAPTCRQSRRASTSLSAGTQDEGADAVLAQKTPSSPHWLPVRSARSVNGHAGGPRQPVHMFHDQQDAVRSPNQRTRPP